MNIKKYDLNFSNKLVLSVDPQALWNAHCSSSSFEYSSLSSSSFDLSCTNELSKIKTSCCLQIDLTLCSLTLKCSELC